MLTAIQLLNESHARELARVLDMTLSAIQKALAGLERDGLVAARVAGRTRLYRLNPSYFALAELRPYLDRLAQADPSLLGEVQVLRRRPRRTGKPL